MLEGRNIGSAGNKGREHAAGLERTAPAAGERRRDVGGRDVVARLAGILGGDAAVELLGQAHRPLP